MTQVYVASVYANGYREGTQSGRYEKLTEFERDITKKIPHILESYHYINKQTMVDSIRRDDGKVFLDSGAFSAYTLGVTIDLPTYCQYIIQNQDIIIKDNNSILASVLDGIGDPLLTYQNQKQMESFGVTPLPCFHKNEDPRYLEYYLSNYEYITIGGMVGSSVKSLEMYLDEIWEKYMLDSSGNPKCKVHGFGMTSLKLMKRYPWYSCDSSSWIQVAAFGSIQHLDLGVIPISDKSPSRKTMGRHLTTLTEPEKDYIEKEIENTGFNHERLSQVYESRAVFNIHTFTRMTELLTHHGSDQLKITQQGLF